MEFENSPPNASLEDFFERYKYTSLNPQQKEAVKTVDGPVLLLAVPGSGKTTVIVARTGYMTLAKGISPKKILCLTYTTAAAKEMKVRFANKFQCEDDVIPHFSTIHSFCVKVIRYAVEHMGVRVPMLQPKNEVAVRDIYIQSYGLYPQETTIKSFVREIGYIKNKMLRPEEFEDKAVEGIPVKDFYYKYLQYMQEHNWMDFDDQLGIAYQLLCDNHNNILGIFQEQFRYICIDESQDTSLIQHKIIQLLASRYKNIFMVGDDDQSIYGFRAACPSELLNFSQTYPGAKILTMGTNYRSATRIVTAANSFIKQNKARYKKEMVPFKDSEGVVETVYRMTDDSQYEYLLDAVKKTTVNRNKTLAILYRNNESAIPLLNLLLRDGISVRFRDEMESFFSHWIVQDIRNIMAYTYDQKNFQLFKKIYYRLGLFIKKTSLPHIECYMKQNPKATAMDALIAVDRNAQNILDRRHINFVFKAYATKRPKAVIDMIMDDIGYASTAKASSDDGGSVYSKANTLALIAVNCKTFEEFQNSIIRITTAKPNYNSVVTLSTIHSSKGLEFDHVIMIDIHDGILPSSDSKEDDELYEEDTRLFYVGATRAKEKLTFLISKGNYYQTYEPSDYIKEFSLGVREQKRDPLLSLGLSDKVLRKLKRVLEPDISAFEQGARIEHRDFGQGIIKSVEKNGIATIVFTRGKEEKMLDLKTCIENKILYLL